MFCKNCGNEIGANAAVCLKCGVAVGTGNAHCPNCANPTQQGAVVCTSCVVALVNPIVPVGKSRVMVGVLGLFFGSLGIHNFILGNTAKAVIQLVLSMFGWVLLFIPNIVVGIWALVESIMILAGAINEDANGTPLI